MSAVEQQVLLDSRVPEVIIRVMITPDRAIHDFLGDCRARGWSERSISTYAATLYRFLDRLPVDIDVSKITTDDLRRYRASRQRQVARNTLAGEEAHLASWLGSLYKERKIASNPIDRLERTKRIPAEDLDVITVAPVDVPRMLQVALPGTERNATAIVSYLGPRRRAIATLRDTDYDQDAGTIRFREKGSKTIVKPAPDELRQVLDASIARGDIRKAPENYLVPPEGYLQRTGDRDDRVIWRVIKRVAERAGVDAHVHALRAAFAVYYLEQNADHADALLSLKELLGHRSLNTTMVYLRRLNKQAAMGHVRSLSWATTSGADGAAWLSQSHPTPLVASSGVGAGGFEPPSDDSPGVERGGGQHPAVRAATLKLEQLRRDALERADG